MPHVVVQLGFVKIECHLLYHLCITHAAKGVLYGLCADLRSEDMNSIKVVNISFGYTLSLHIKSESD